MHYPLLEPFQLHVETLIQKEPHPPFIELNQVHGKKVLLVDSSSPQKQDGDGMITQEIGLKLLIKHADCQVAIAYDPIRHALGVAHAGWRGQVLGLYSALIQAMQEAFGTEPKDLKVVFAPSLGPTKSEFINYRHELPQWMWAFEEAPLHFNLWKIAEKELFDLGIQPQNLSLPPCCTYLDTRFHSYRRDKTTLRNKTVSQLLKGP
jgi:YfiH family protein